MSEPVFDPTTVTGSADRDMMLRLAIGNNGADDLAAIQAALPEDFNTDAEEVAKMVEAMGLPKIEGEPAPPVEGEPVTVEGEPTPTVDPRDPVPGERGYEAASELPPGAVVEQSSGDDGEQQHPADTDLPSPEMTLSEAQEVLADWQHKMQMARIALHDRTMEQKQTRSKLVESINFFLRGGPQSQDDLKREYLASEQQKRINGDTRRGRAPSHGPSVVDVGRAGRGGSINRRYGAVRRGLLPGQRAYSLEGAMARSGSGIVDTGGLAKVPVVAKSE